MDNSYRRLHWLAYTLIAPLNISSRYPRPRADGFVSVIEVSRNVAALSFMSIAECKSLFAPRHFDTHGNGVLNRQR